MTRPPPIAADVAAATPARRLDLPLADGCRVLPGEHGDWLDGGEERIAEIIRGAADLSSMSEELARHQADWIERYHLSHERANVVRALDIPADAVVLEIGAGCGAVTRYLGERAAIVDALEPTPERAAVARERTRDLPGVELFAGGLEALPAEPAYDLIVIIGVLEYVGGADGPAPRVAFLREVAARLNEGGAVACAIENQLGVKYLAGAPEDHAGVPFEGLEGYPRRGPYRTFPRRELERIFSEAGLTPDVFHAFPDYKTPRLIYGDKLLEGDAAPLAWRGARFPSPDAPLSRPRLASEEQLWRSAVRGGLGGELANSFLVLGRSGARSPWPEDLRAVFWSSGRRARFTTATRLLAGGDGGARVERGYLAEAEEPRGREGLEHACVGTPYLTGTPLSELLEELDADALGDWLKRWRRHAEGAATAGTRGTNIDVGPQNVIVEGDDLVTIDEEWWHPGYAVEDALDRSMLYLAFGLANGRAPGRWPERCTTVADALAELYRGAGLDAPGDERLAAIVRREAELQAQIRDRDPDEPDWEPTVAAHVEDLTVFLERPLSETALGRREPEALATLAAHAAAQDAAVAELHRAYAALQHDAQKAGRVIDEQTAALRETDATVTELLAQVGERNRELFDLARRFDELAAAHREVVESKSWRYTGIARDAAARYKARRSST